MKDMQQGDRRPTMAVDMLIGTIITIHTVLLGRTIATSIMSMEKDMDTVTMEKRDTTWSMPDLTSITTMLHWMTTVTITSSSQQETSSSPPRASTCRLLPSQTRISKRSTLHTPPKPGDEHYNYIDPYHGEYSHESYGHHGGAHGGF
jgi:hypothetical protein